MLGPGDQCQLLVLLLLLNPEAKPCLKAIGERKVKSLHAGFSPSDLIL